MREATTESTYSSEAYGHPEANASGVSWSAVIAGALAGAALALILLALGAGLGLSSVSPWSNMGASASTIGKSTIIWLTFMEIVSSSMGGYLAGRLRTKWTRVHSDEVYFRDTAHGFLAWCTGMVIAATCLGSAAAIMVGAPASSKKDAAAQTTSENTYFVDSLFRDPARPDAATPEVRKEVAVIFLNGLRQGALPANDKSYLDQLVAAKTGSPPAQADARVSYAFGNAQQAADTARKALAHSLLWMFIALLIGAFCASFAATIGGRQRDHVISV